MQWRVRAKIAALGQQRWHVGQIGGGAGLRRRLKPFDPGLECQIDMVMGAAQGEFDGRVAEEVRPCSPLGRGAMSTRDAITR